jgi:hypothetical protein
MFQPWNTSQRAKRPGQVSACGHSWQIACPGWQIAFAGWQIACLGCQIACAGWQIACLGCQIACHSWQVACPGWQIAFAGWQIAFVSCCWQITSPLLFGRVIFTRLFMRLGRL